MRKFYLVVALAILIQACAGMPFGDVFLPPTDTPVPPTSTATVTFTPMDTPTATITPSITPSPTIVHLPTWDPNQPTATTIFIPIPIFIGNVTATPIVPPTPFRPGPGFLSVLVSDNKIFWGSCKPNRSTITAEVENPEDVFSVVIFVRVKSAAKEDYTPWTTGNTMQKHGGGTFSYLLKANTTEGHNHYKNSWVFFQLVATDDLGREIGRTMIYTNAIALSPCM